MRKKIKMISFGVDKKGESFYRPKIMRFPTLTLAAFALVSTASISFAQYEPVTQEDVKSRAFTFTGYVKEEYDDNFFTANSTTAKEDIFSTLVQPGVVFNMPLDQTSISARYLLGLSLYADRPGDNILDVTHDFLGQITHEFSPRFAVDFKDQFRFTSEPEIRSGGAFRRRQGDYFQNTFAAFGKAQWVPRFGNTIEYDNMIVDYTDPVTSDGQDRMEHTVALDNRWQWLTTTTAILGYRINFADYKFNTPGADKDSTGHYVYVGADHKFTERWAGMIRAGAEFRYFNTGMDQTNIGPYASIGTDYEYAQGCKAGFNYTHTMSMTDINTYTIQTTDTLALNIFQSITRRFGARLDGTYTMGYLQDTNMIGAVKGANMHDNIFNVAPTLVYTFNKYLSAELGYSYTRLDSDIDTRDYDRNRVFVGVRGTY